LIGFGESLGMPAASGGRELNPRAYVCRLLPLTCLTPDIVEAILDGRQPKGLRLAEMLGNGPLAWNVQTETWGLAIDTELLRVVRSRGRT
jgi:hypothetical protein